MRGFFFMDPLHKPKTAPRLQPNRGENWPFLLSYINGQWRVNKPKQIRLTEAQKVQKYGEAKW